MGIQSIYWIAPNKSFIQQQGWFQSHFLIHETVQRYVNTDVCPIKWIDYSNYQILQRCMPIIIRPMGIQPVRQIPTYYYFKQ